MGPSPAQPDLNLLKQVNRQFVSGVTVVTAMDGQTPRGLAVNAFSSISLDPPTVMVAVQRTSSTHDCLYRATHLAINILSTTSSMLSTSSRQRPTTNSPALTGCRTVRQPADRAQRRADGSRNPRPAAGQHPHGVHLPRRARHGKRPPCHGLHRLGKILRRRRSNTAGLTTGSGYVEGEPR